MNTSSHEDRYLFFFCFFRVLLESVRSLLFFPGFKRSLFAFVENEIPLLLVHTHNFFFFPLLPLAPSPLHLRAKHVFGAPVVDMDPENFPPFDPAPYSFSTLPTPLTEIASCLILSVSPFTRREQSPFFPVFGKCRPSPFMSYRLCLFRLT